MDLHLPGSASSGTLLYFGSALKWCSESDNRRSFYRYFRACRFLEELNFVWSNTSIMISGSKLDCDDHSGGDGNGRGIPAQASTPPSPSPPTISGLPERVGQAPARSLRSTGITFSPNLLQNTVYFGAVRGVVTALPASSSLSVQVPYGAAYGPVTVTEEQIWTVYLDQLL